MHFNEGPSPTKVRTSSKSKKRASTLSIDRTPGAPNFICPHEKSMFLSQFHAIFPDSQAPRPVRIVNVFFLNSSLASIGGLCGQMIVKELAVPCNPLVATLDGRVSIYSLSDVKQLLCVRLALQLRRVVLVRIENERSDLHSVQRGKNDLKH